MPVKKRVSRRGWVDPDDAPEWTKEQFERAEVAVGAKVVQRTQGTLTRARGRPKKAGAKIHTPIRLSPQVLGYFRATGPGWPTRIDEVLRNWAEKHRSDRRPRVKRNCAASDSFAK